MEGGDTEVKKKVGLECEIYIYGRQGYSRSRHGRGRWFGESGGREAGWWKAITSLVEGNDGRWFWERLGQELGDGRNASFWEGAWSGDVTLRELFPRLYLLITRKEGVVGDMGEWIDGKWIWKVEWRRELLDRERGSETELAAISQQFLPRRRDK